MSEPSPADPPQTPTLAGRIDEACDRFEAEWRAGAPPRLEAYLDGESGSLRPPLLRALLDLELELRSKAGERLEPRHYHDRFPEHADLIRGAFAALTADRTVLPPRSAGRGDQPDPANYEILGELGRGGMGIVYRARDRRSGQVVALKTVRHAEPEALLRFKREFRTLADVSHPNLVSLYELVSDGRDWFFTMELVHGVDLVSYVRTPTALADTDHVEEIAGPAAVPWDGPETDSDRAGDAGPSPPRPGDREAVAGDWPGAGLSPPQLRRLRVALRGLACGVQALHEAGRLHRDIKPSNVLVRPGGRAVLLDFGLVAELGPGGDHQSSLGHILGTAAYMAPEQGTGSAVGAAADWYGVGALLYEALTGRPPFRGTYLEVLMDKQRFEPAPPGQLVAGVPEDLQVLCVELLRRRPEARPTGPDVLRRLGGPMAEPPSNPASPARRDVPLVGRERHLEALAGAFEAVRGGRAVVMLVHGRSGAGKTALVRRFLEDLAGRGEAVVLAGRCHEQESVPYKALDSLVDELGRFLRRQPPDRAQVLLPRDVGPLVQVFPGLRQAEVVAAAPGRAEPVPDPQEARRRAFAALRELLGRLGDRRPLVLAIDDLQWGDADSAALLAEILRPPDPPPLLLLGCYRSEDAAISPLLRVLREASPAGAASPERRELAVEPLPTAEAEALALALLGDEGRGGPVATARAAAIAREAGGSPFFIHELARHLRAGAGPPGDPSAGVPATLDDVLWARISRLPEGARRLLEVVAIAGRPLGQAEACRAAALEADERAALGVLRVGRLIRGTGSPGADRIETYHDRVRETVVAHLPPAVRAGHHLRLASTLEATGQVDPEVLAVHYRGAGRAEEAGRYFAAAAAQAAEALAFDRAAKLYRLALDLRPGGGEAGRRLRMQLGDALANAGRGAEAAREYLEAAEGADPAGSVEARRRAALQLLISGHIDEGLATLRVVLDAVGMRAPGSPRRALLSLFLRRALLRLRGLRFRRRDPSAVPAAELTRLDICLSAAAGLTMVDHIYGSAFQARSLLLALRAGEPSRIARALAWEAGHVSGAGSPSRGRTERLLRVARGLAEREAQPAALGTVALVEGIAAFCRGLWPDARSHCDRAEALFRDRCAGVTWEVDTLHFFGLWALLHLGEVAELGRRWPILLQEAHERGDRYAATSLSTEIMAGVRLAADDPEGARDELSRAIGQWSQQGFHIQHYAALTASVHIDLYSGHGRAARDRVAQQWPALEHSLLLNVQKIRVDMFLLRASSALAAATAAADPGPLLWAARRDARRVEREGVPWAQASAALVRTGIAAARGDRVGAAALLARAATAFDALEMRLCAAATRRRLGTIIGGDEGRALVTAADTWMAGQRIQNPARMAAMYTPGFPD